MGGFPLRIGINLAIVFSLLGASLAAQPQISGHILLDTTRWQPVAFLSIIPDFTQLHSVSNEAIIQKATINREGYFSFKADSLGSEDHLYRVHFSRQGDPQASLIIGGPDENHLFLIANNHSDVALNISGSSKLIRQMAFAGYPPNQALLEINRIAAFLDTLDYYGPAVNRDFVRQAVYDKLRQYADTCSNPLISLYALYHSRFESNYSTNPGYYEKYLRKWKREDSEYFVAFRAQLPVKEKSGWLFPGFLILLVFAGTTLFLMLRRKKEPEKNPYQTLSVQERRIFGLLKDGRSNKEISDECGISLSTVKSHVNNIYSKLSISSRTDVMDYPT